MKQKITILGSTGSIGKNTLDVVARHPDRYEVFALSAATQVDLMLEQCAQFKPRFAVMASAPHAQLLAEKIKQNGLQTSVLQAQGALEIIASHEEVDAVMAAIVGAAGLSPCLAAARARAVPPCCPSTASIQPFFNACLKILRVGPSGWTAFCSPLLAARSVPVRQRPWRRSPPTRPVRIPISPWDERSRWTPPR